MQSCCMYTIAIEIAAVRLLSDQTQSVTLLSFFLRSDVKECAFAPKLCCVVAVSCSLVVTAPPLPGDEGDDLSVASN